MATHARPVDAGGGTNTTSTAPTDAPASGPADQPGLVFVLMIGIFLSVLDFFIVSVAVPSIQRDLSATSATVQLTIAAYALGYAGLLIVGGRLGDIFGRRRMFSAGILLFTVASAVCGVAPNAESLIAGRSRKGSPLPS
nr:MFS transporter [Salinispora arenicola]